MFDFEIKGISEAINQIVHDESLPAKPEWRYRTPGNFHVAKFLRILRIEAHSQKFPL